MPYFLRAGVQLKQRIGDVTAVVTGYKHESFIRECLDSILHQTVTPEKLIIIDDCSNDRTEAVCFDWIEGDRKSVV